jgi:hypothetical protein
MSPPPSPTRSRAPRAAASRFARREASITLATAAASSGVNVPSATATRPRGVTQWSWLLGGFAPRRLVEDGHEQMTTCRHLLRSPPPWPSPACGDLCRPRERPCRELALWNLQGISLDAARKGYFIHAGCAGRPVSVARSRMSGAGGTWRGRVATVTHRHRGAGWGAVGTDD